MEALGAVTGGAWSSPGGMYASEEANFMAQLLGKCTFPSEIEGGSVHDVQSSSWPSHGSSFDLPIPMMSASAMCSSGMPDPYLSSYEMGTDFLLSGTSDHESYYLNHSDPAFARNSSSVPMEYCLGRFSGERNVESGDSAVKEPIIRETCSQLELQGSQVHGVELSPMGDEALSSGAFRKRSRPNEDLHKNTRMGISKVARKLDFSSNSEEEANVAHPTGPSSSPCQSEDGSTGGATCSSLSLRGSTPNANSLTLISPAGKTRASRGSATDPQSLYARKRREKINERLRILQSLVPNGTKVDISTMLEEALHYVKFLQLQIQLLSSDELWMYAPIAYNGMDIGLNKNTRGRLL